jgi:endonuclease/exonuclease/phosphatase family metal-dependent hydrolase
MYTGDRIARGVRTCALLCMTFTACATEDAQDTLTQADTGPITFRCPAVEDSGPGQCKSIPPLTKPAVLDPESPVAPWVVDGGMDRNEYYGAVTFPYSNPAMKVAGGKVLVAYDNTALHVFLKDLPGVATGSIRIYLDYERSEGRSAETYALPDGQDRAYDLDLASGIVTPMKAVTEFGYTHWVPIPFLQICRRFFCTPIGWEVEVPPFDAKLGAVHPGGPGDAPRFDAEFSITLRTLTKISPQEVPGVGFAVAQLQQNGTTGIGAYPEELALFPPSGAIQNPKDDDRTLFETLVFGPPRGVDIAFTTFNIKRFTPVMHELERKLAPDGLDDWKIPSSLIGEYISQFDVIALEEAWDTVQANEVINTANALRAFRGLPPYFVTGPPREKDPAILAGWSTFGMDESNGGVYILSRYPFARTDWKTYDTCRGEDCVKKKGVLYARLWFGAPDDTCNPNLGCPRPSGDGYIDVFATHLNADPGMCLAGEASEAGDYLKEIAATGALCTSVLPLCALYEIYTKLVFNCWSPGTNAEARADQLAQMNEFITAETADDPTRPSIVMGDFNIDGKYISAVHAADFNRPEYQQMMSTLRLVAPGHEADELPMDWVNPWRGAAGWDWDIDHADVARETVGAELATGAKGIMTNIGRDTPPDGVGSRYDYVFVRPGTRPESPMFENSRWVVAKGTVACTGMPGCDSGGGAAPVWRSPFPAASVPIDSLGNRLSDHQPVIASLKMVQLEVPPKYHPDWNHNYAMQVTAAAADDSDCALGICGGLDLYPNLAKVRFDPAWTKTEWYEHGETCANRNAVSVNVDPCMASWSYHDVHDPALNVSFRGGASLWDADSGPDDHYSTVVGDRAPVMQINWAAALITTAGWVSGAPVPDCKPFPITDNAPVPCCTRNGGSYACLETRWTEVVPP